MCITSDPEYISFLFFVCFIYFIILKFVSMPQYGKWSKRCKRYVLHKTMYLLRFSSCFKLLMQGLCSCFMNVASMLCVIHSFLRFMHKFEISSPPISVSIKANGESFFMTSCCLLFLWHFLLPGLKV